MTDLEIYTAVIEHPNLKFIEKDGGSIRCIDIQCEQCPLCTKDEETGWYHTHCHPDRINLIMDNLSIFEFQYKANQ